MMRVDFSVIFDETLQPVSLVVRCGRKGRGCEGCVLRGECDAITGLIERRLRRMREVSLITEHGGVALGRLDDQGRLVYRAGKFVPTTDPDKRDRLLREGVERIVDDGGKTYYERLAGVLPAWWLVPSSDKD